MGKEAGIRDLDRLKMRGRIMRRSASFNVRYPAVSVPALKEIIRRGRLDGFVHNPGLFAQGSWAIGVPVRVKGRKPRAALSIASIEERMTGARVFELTALLQQEARLIADAVTDRPAPSDDLNTREDQL